MDHSKDVFTVKTLTQQALFVSEVRGQLSDGLWENYPGDHWKDWCMCKVVVGNNIGTNFWVIKNNYALTKLVEYVGDRMTFMGQLATMYPKEVAQFFADGHSRLPEGLDDYKNYIEWSKTGSWALNTLSDWEIAGITKEVVADVEARGNEFYTEKTLRQDLAALKKAMKSRSF